MPRKEDKIYVSMLPLNEVNIAKGRQRAELGDVESLAESIRRHGLLSPIVVDKDNNLIAGERRFVACRLLAWQQIPVRYLHNLSPIEKQIIEFEENYRRKNLTWQEECLAVYNFDKQMRENSEDWTNEKTGNVINLSHVQARERVIVGKALAEGEKIINTFATMGAAYNYLERIQHRAISAEIDTIIDIDELPDILPQTQTRQQILTPDNSRIIDVEIPPSADEYIIQASFSEWIQTYAGEKFNLIHCDFPYGVGMHRSDQNKSAMSLGVYNDTERTWQDLYDSFFTHFDKFIAKNAHIIFWLPMRRYDDVYRDFNNIGSDWWADPYPLIWNKSDGAGLLPDAQRGPRRCYETALFITRGDRRIVRATGNVSSFPTPDKSEHYTQKPLEMLMPFFRMLCDRSSTVFDPTCGSGTAIEAGLRCGANRVLGVELDPIYAELCKKKVARFLKGESSGPTQADDSAEATTS